MQPKVCIGQPNTKPLLRFVEVLMEAFYESVNANKQLLLRKANLILEKLRYYWRLGQELGYYGSGQLGEISKRLLEIGRMVGGWLNNLKKQQH